MLLSLTAPGDVVLTEALTYPGFIAAARKLGVRLVGVTMDEQRHSAGSALPARAGSISRKPSILSPPCTTPRP